MKLTKQDVQIVVEMLLNRDYLTTTDLAKKIYNPKDRKELQDCDAKIRRRLNKLVKYGILVVEENNGRKVYALKEGVVFIGIKSGDNITFVTI